MTERAYAPHCDSSILHAPGVCEYCDHYPDWQELRKLWRIAFTGEPSDEHTAPDPSSHFRPVAVSHQWPGNTPEGYTQYGSSFDAEMPTEVWFCARKLGHSRHTYNMPSGYDEQGIKVIEGRRATCTGWPVPNGPGFDGLNWLQKLRARLAFRREEV